MNDNPIRIVVDPDLLDLIPNFLARRELDAEALLSALDAGDFETIHMIGHSMKGSGGGYGFDGLTEIGAALQQAGITADPSAARAAHAALVDYLARVVIVDG